MQKKNDELNVPLLAVPAQKSPTSNLTRSSTEKAVAATSIPAKPKIGTKIPTKLNEINLKKPEVQELSVEVRQTPIGIDPEQFSIALSEFITVMEMETRNALVAVLKNRTYCIENNKVIFTVINEVEQNLLYEVRDRMVLYFREKCNNPTILQEVIVDESQKPEKNFLTDEDKKRLMEEKNPFFRLLQKKFNTGLDYRG